MRMAESDGQLESLRTASNHESSSASSMGFFDQLPKSTGPVHGSRSSTSPGPIIGNPHPKASPAGPKSRPGSRGPPKPITSATSGRPAVEAGAGACES